MSSSLTEQELKYATDIAYLDLEMLKEHGLESIPGSVTAEKGGSDRIRDLLQLPPTGQSTKDQSHFNQIGADKAVKNNDSIVSLDAGKINSLPSDVLDWKIIKSYDDNRVGESGLYATVIETPKGMIVSFRGSEAFSELQNVEQDWIGADAALISGDLTAQQREVEVFLQELKDEGFFEKYDNITFAGHSLGGNLAEHATFTAAKLGVVDRIDQTISYDGPGFAQEYLDRNKQYISEATSTVDMYHVEQSLVGGILQQVPGISYFFAELGGKGLVQHGTENVVFDANGNIVRKENGRTILSHIVTPFTQGIDRMLGERAGSALVTGLIALTSKVKPIKDAIIGPNGKLTVAGGLLVTGLVVGLVTAAIVMGPVALVTAVAVMAAKVLGYVLLFVASVIVYEYISDLADAVVAFTDYLITEFVPAMIQQISEAVGTAFRWAGEQIKEFMNTMAGAFRGMMDGLRSLFSSGAAVATPYIEVNTYKLRHYAARLNRVRARIRDLDGDMNSLYLTAGLLDILSILRANSLPSSYKMNKCINYLEDTAEAFERAERNIMASV
ncbi:Mbeg1-like protein [Bacillus sp. EB01]|uniref:Mbeg1-like protein n=1 Tax=Bacillus sp. EB01 TaxID=1347086 RepID=UPI0005C4B9CE|nr:Mbeg1-like protein [Bacillus sp. EB01]